MLSGVLLENIPVLCTESPLSSGVRNEPFKSQLLLELITNRRQGKLICTYNNFINKNLRENWKILAMK